MDKKITQICIEGIRKMEGHVIISDKKTMEICDGDKEGGNKK